MADREELSIRRAVRHEVFLPAQIAVAPEHAEIVRLASTTRGEAWIEVDLIDFSACGVGMISPTYLPRNCLVQIRVLSPDERQSEPLFEAVARIQRIVMTDRRPAYLVGTSFIELTPKQQDQIDSVLARLDEDEQTNAA